MLFGPNALARRVGHPFRDTMSQSIGALSVAALSQRMKAPRIRAIKDALQTACLEVEQCLRACRNRRRALEGRPTATTVSSKNPVTST